MNRKIHHLLRFIDWDSGNLSYNKCVLTTSLPLANILETSIAVRFWEKSMIQVFYFPKKNLCSNFRRRFLQTKFLWLLLHKLLFFVSKHVSHKNVSVSPDTETKLNQLFNKSYIICHYYFFWDTNVFNWILNNFIRRHLSKNDFTLSGSKPLHC